MSQYNLPDLRPQGGGNSSAAQPQQAAPAQRGSLPDLRPAPTSESLDIEAYSKDQLVEAYRQLPRDDPRREIVKQQIIKLNDYDLNREGMSATQSAVAGATDAMSLGLSDELNAGWAAVTGGSYDDELKRQREMMRNAQEDNSGAYLGGQIAGTVAQAIPTLGASVPSTMAGRVAINVGGGALQGGIYGGASSEGDMTDRLGDAWEGAGWGAAFGAIPTVGEVAWKGGKAAVRGATKNIQKITNPRAYVEKEIVDDIASDWMSQQRLDQKAFNRGQAPLERRFLDGQDVLDAEAAGQRTMVSDLGGDTLRRKLKAVDNYSPEGSRMMRGAAAMRQTTSGQRVADVVSDSFGDTLNPKTVRDELLERARVENDAAYRAAEANPNSAHLWNPRLQGALSSSAGREALNKAIIASRDEAIRNGENILEPIFEEGADGLMQFSGRFRRPTGEIADDIQGVGLSLRFWDQVKRGFDKVIEDMPATAKTEAARIRSIKNDMINALDAEVPEYAAARGTARDFFGMEDAHEAGAEYFKKMSAYGTAEARAALQSMKPAERELFARGYAAELVQRITQMGDAENVNKLFRSPEARMKMRDALGNRAADQLEAYTHREMVQGLLGRHLGENSTTMQQAIAAEGLKLTATTAAGIYSTGDVTTGLIAGLALRGGFKFTQRKIIQRYAREMAELATSEDPVVIARILNKVAKQTGYMEFSRAVSNGAASVSGAGARGAAGFSPANPGSRIEPRMPFADGGMVEEDPVPFKGGGLAKAAVDVIGDWLWRAEPEVAQELGLVGKAMPEHVDTFGHYMKGMAEKAGNEGLSDRDLIKAYTITRSSIQRGAVDAEKLRANGFDIPGATGMVRPEGAFSEWLLTPMGKRYLDNAEMGVVDEEAILDAQSKMAPFGKHETDLPDFMRNAVNLRGRAEETSGLVDRAYRGLSDPQEWRDATDDLRGIGPSKKGFYASLLGRGDQPTLDARQITLHTGKPTKEASKYIARRGGKGGEAAVDRLAERQRNMDMQVAPELEPFYQHLAHHTVWDTVANERTTHEDIIRAMRLAAAAGAIPAGIAAAGEENILNAMGDQNGFADGGVVGYSKGGLIKATFAEMMRLAGITSERDMKEIAKAYGNVTKLHPKEWEYEYRDLGNIHRPEGVFDPEQAVRDNATFMQLYGDKSPAGRELVSINGHRLRTPVVQQGGNEFIYGPNGRAENPAAWASLPGAVTILSNRVKSAPKDGPLYGVYAAMGPEGVDFSTMPIKSVLGLMGKNSMGILNDVDGAVMDALKPSVAEKYPGLVTKAGREALLSNADGMGGMRSKIMKTMDTADWKDTGLPEIGPIRWANTDPALVDVPNGMMGRSIARMDPSGARITDLVDPHETYPHGLGGTPMPGDDMNVPADVWFSSIYRPRLQALGIDTLGERQLPSTELRLLLTNDLKQKADQQWLDTFLGYKEGVKSGKIKPPTGPRAKPLKGRK